MDSATITHIADNRTPLHSEHLKELVKRRELTYDAELYGGDVSMKTLGAIVEDFHQVYEDIKTQSLERYVVSMACLVAMTNHAAEKCLMRYFANVFQTGKHANMGKWFLLKVITPSTGCALWDAAYNSYVLNAAFVVDAEKRAPWVVPCFIEAFDISGFTNLSIPEKYSVLGHIKSKNVVVEEVRAAFGAFQKLGPVPVELDDGVADFTDVYIGDKKMTEIRNGYVNVTFLSKVVDERALFNDYIKLAGNRKYVDSYKLPDGGPLVCKPENTKGSTWIHPKIAVHLAKWKGLDDLAAILEVYEDDTVSVVSTQKSPHRLEIWAISAEGITTEMRGFDGYCNGAAIAASFGKVWANIAQLENFHAKVAEVSSRINVSVQDLILVTYGKYASVWVHPEVACVLVDTYKPKALAAFCKALDVDPRPADEEHTTVFDDKGKVVTKHRLSDGYLETNMISKWSPKNTTLSSILRIRFGSALKEALAAKGIDPIKKTTGLYGGTWAHPDLAGGLAKRAGLDTLPALVTAALTAEREPVAVRTNVTYEEKEVDAQQIVYQDPNASCSNVFELAEAAPFIGGHAIPRHFLSPNTFYIVQVGVLPDGRIVFKWGITDNWKRRELAHRDRFKNIITRVLISVGMYTAKNIEDNIKSMMAPWRIFIANDGPVGRETFATTAKESEEIVDRIRVHVETKYEDMCEYSFKDGVVHMDKTKQAVEENTALAVEKEKTRRELALQQGELAIKDKEIEILKLQLQLSNK
jgi:hypothetical protein